MGGEMSKEYNAYTIEHLAPFDVPSEFEKARFIKAEDSVHVSGKVFHAKRNYYTSLDFGKIMNSFLESDYVRNADFIVSLSAFDEAGDLRSDGDLYITLHTKESMLDALVELEV